MLTELFEIKQKSISRILFLSFLFIIHTNFYAQIIPTKLIDEISNYKIGDDRSKLSEITEIVLNTLKDETKTKTVEKEILTFIKSDFSFDAKQFASRQLRIVGSEVSAIELKDFLLNENTSDLARYALEGIKSEAVDNLLIEALPQVSKKNQLGIINSLGIRKNQKSVKPISAFLTNKDFDLSVCAASALGKIANEECKTVLENNLNVTNENLRNTILTSYVNCLDKISKEINTYKDYEKLYNNKNIPTPIKYAALNGIINTSQNKIEEIQKRITSEPFELKFIPISKIKELPNETDFTIFAKQLSYLDDENQIQLLGALECVGKSNVKQYVLEMLKSNNELVRIAAIKTLKNIGDKNDVLVLAQIASSKSGDESDYAQASIDELKGNDIDDEIIKNLNSSDENIKLELIRTVGSRNIKSALNMILNLTKSENKIIKSEAIRTLGEIASEDNLQDLIAILIQQDEVSDKRKVERTISGIINKSTNKINSANILIDSCKTNSNVDNKSSFLRLLGYTSSDNAYLLLENELDNKTEAIKIAAIQGLSNWSTLKPMNGLIKVAENTNNENIKSAAVKGFTNFIEIDKNLTASEKIELYKKSLNLSQTSNEKNIALDGIGHIDDFESLEIFKSYLNQSDLKETVDDAINRVAWHLHKTNPEKVKEYIQYFLTQIRDEKFQTKNSELINVIDRFIKQRDNK